MLLLHVEAPFAVCRTFTAGWYRPTATFLTPSAANGLLLNLAGMESRLREEHAEHDGKTPASYFRSGLPTCRIAVGAAVHRDASPNDLTDCLPRLQSAYQQLHNYPVGATGSERAEQTHGSKYNITPVRREYLANLSAVIAVDAERSHEAPCEALVGAIREGLSGHVGADRYGLPFLGDNAFLPDRIRVIDQPEDDRWLQGVFWYERLDDSTRRSRRGATRLTTVIDRADMSRTVSGLFAPTETTSWIPAQNAWSLIQPTEPPSPAKATRKKH